MRHLTSTAIDKRNKEFEVLTQGSTLQIAHYVIQPGADSGSYKTEHPESDQVLYVTEGQGEATVSGETVSIAEGDVLLIVAGEDHLIRNTGKGLLRSLNVYSPPAY